MWKLGNILSHSFSILLNPLLMPFYSIGLLFVYTNFYILNTSQTFSLLIPILLIGCIIPALFLLMLSKLRYVKNITDISQTGRILPLINFAIFNLLLVYYFYQVGYYLWFLGLLAIPAILALIALLVNFIWKISLHGIGIGGLIGGVLSVCYNVKGVNPYELFIILFVLAGCLGVSRLYLRKNTAAQIYIGFIIGLFVSYLCVLVSVYSFSFSIK